MSHLNKRAFYSCIVLLFLIGSCRHDYLSDHHGVRIGIVYNIGGKDDSSYNNAAWRGLQKAQQEFGVIRVHDIEPSGPSSIEPSLRALAESRCNLIIGVGLIHKDVIERIALEYPDLHFVVVDSLASPSNVASIIFSEEEGSYLVGIIAGLESKTGTIGFIGGMDIPLIRKFHSGFEQGARSVNPNVKMLKGYIGVTDAAWNDPIKAHELALSQLNRNADVIYAVAGNSGLGVFDAVEEFDGRYVIGVDSNQNALKPGHVLTSMVKSVDIAVYQIVKAEVEGDFRGGPYIGNLKNGGVSYAIDENNEHLIQPETLRMVEEAKQKIITGQLHIQSLY